jgi:hypothetical protein
MNKRIYNYAKHLVMALFLGLFAVSFSGCEKEEDNAPKFAGTWNGTSMCGGSSNTGPITFTNAGKNTITTPFNVGSGSCAQSKTLTGTVSGNTATFSSTTYTDGCGGSYTVSASASLSGSNITFTLTVTGATNGTCTFTGTK